jgi:hypothetical protein
MRYGRVKCCKVIDFDAVDLRKNGDFKFSRSSFGFLRIHIWLTPLLAYTVAQHIRSLSFTAVNIFVRSTDRGFVEHVLEPAMNLCL